MQIHWLVTALPRLIANDIYGKIGTSMVALRRYQALILHSIRIIIPAGNDACWGTQRIAQFHELWQVNWPSCHVKEIEVKCLAEETVHKTSRHHGTSAVNDIVVGLNRH